MFSREVALKILHLVRNLEDARALITVEEQQRQGHETTVILLHDAVLSPQAWPGRVFACQDDVKARQERCRYPGIDYDGIIQAIFDHERVISW